MTSTRRLFLWLAVCAASLHGLAEPAFGTGVPIGGFLPMVGIALTDEFDDDLNTFPTATTGVGGTLLGAGGVPYYDVALLDTGAAVSLLTRQAFINFGMNSASSGEPDGYQGTETIAIGGATGTLLADINDPHGLYAGGLQLRTGTTPLMMNGAVLDGQTNTSTITLPAESDLPNVVGLSYASQYATYIRSDQPQIFSLGGKTVRTPSIEFLPLGSGGQGIVRRAPLTLNPSASFQQPPSWFYNIENLDLDNPHENPSIPTVIQGGLFLNVNLANNGSTLNNSSFFFDTGADVSVLSELTALQLGIDVVLDEPDFTVAVIGSGGEKSDVPGYFLDTFTIQAIGGSVTATNVPVIVLDVADPANPANIVPGIVGTNLLAGRNLVIDPNPSLGGGGSPSLFISDPVTNQRDWAATASSATWSNSSSWTGGVPTVLSVANFRNALPSGNQSTLLRENVSVWELNVSGAAGRSMKLIIFVDGKVTTFAGTNIEEFGEIELYAGQLDSQYVEILGGALRGFGTITTGSGPIPGQVENRSGTIAPGLVSEGPIQVGTLSIVGRFANGDAGTIDLQIIDQMLGNYDRLVVDGPVALDGTLRVSGLNFGSGFAPALGNTFSIITGTEVSGSFSILDVPTLSADKMWAVSYEPTEVLLKVTIPGDFDGDFTVDGDDLAVWREGFGTHYSGGDFLAWQRNLGMSFTPITAIPEPAAAVLAAIGLFGIALRRRSGGLLARGY
jgi:hypothetical protein